MSKKFLPISHQEPLPIKHLIKEEAPNEEEAVPFDVTFVGAGPAGLSAAIELAKLCKDDSELSGTEIGVLEKAGSLGGHNLSGAVINPIGFTTLFPETPMEEFPFRKKVTKEKVYFMTKSSQFRLPTPPTMVNHGNHIASISEMVRWLGEKAEELGVNILPGYPADSLLVSGNRVVGVRTVPAGLDRDGNPGEQHMPPTDISSQVVVMSEGTRGTLAQAFYQWQGIKPKYPQVYALGVKELWRVKKAPEEIIHTLGWPLPRDTFGGSWMYPMSDDVISLGLVAGLDYGKSNLDVHDRLQVMKDHPLFKRLLDGGECIEWGAKTIPEGGYYSIPERLSGDGALVIGDSVGFVNVPALKGIHYAMMSGIYAAHSVFNALKQRDTSQQMLSQYDKEIHSSFILKDLKEVRNMRHVFKGGFFSGGLKAGMMTLTKGGFPGGEHGHDKEDANEEKEFSSDELSLPATAIRKVDAVYMSGNKTRDDIPSHLIVGKDISPEMADFYSHVCPAGVYEQQDGKLVVNAPNCVDCKATDVLGPRWTPREGGSGPDYREM